MGIIHRLKCKYSEPYRIKVGFGLSPIRNDRELRALMWFCIDWLDEPHAALNPAKKKALEATLIGYENPRSFPMEVRINGEWKIYYSLDELIEDNIGYYWS